VVKKSCATGHGWALCYPGRWNFRDSPARQRWRSDVSLSSAKLRWTKSDRRTFDVLRGRRLVIRELPSWIFNITTITVIIRCDHYYHRITKIAILDLQHHQSSDDNDKFVIVLNIVFPKYRVSIWIFYSEFVPWFISWIFFNFIHTLSTVAPKFIDTPEDTQVVEGNAVMLKCSSQGIPNPKITWSRNGHLLTPSRRIRILQSGALQISRAMRRDHGQYTCRAQNKVGYITISARLVIKSKSESTNFIGCSAKLSKREFKRSTLAVTWARSSESQLKNKRWEILCNRSLQFVQNNFTRLSSAKAMRCLL
jgi:hypothetical protein